MQPLSKLEEQLIRSSLATKTDAEIAEILERPVQDIHDAINKITDGGASARNERVIEVKQIMEQEAQNKKASKKKSKRKSLEEKNKDLWDDAVARTVKKKAVKEDGTISNEEHAESRRRREERGKFKTRFVDPNSLHSLRMEDGTILFWEDHQLALFIRETKKGKKEFLEGLRERYSNKFNKTISLVKAQMAKSKYEKKESKQILE